MSKERGIWIAVTAAICFIVFVGWYANAQNGTDTISDQVTPADTASAASAPAPAVPQQWYSTVNGACIQSPISPAQEIQYIADNEGQQADVKDHGDSVTVGYNVSDFTERVVTFYRGTDACQSAVAVEAARLAELQ